MNKYGFVETVASALAVLETSRNFAGDYGVTVASD